ncbi:Ig-like domain-containing protein [Paradesertivirga mongoliensis]|uniref:Ig-like domain-containing protein n=1 Tax=Paradesertivirga mongoliensis TaxID=2100740 RepID=A0ABW4ZM92_9SPHI|nr:Ig-like domain-containing protein [Pedobacter mongoliensis]
MQKKINALIFLLLFCITGAFGQFPYKETFKKSTAPNIVFGGTPTAYLTSGLMDPATGIKDPEGEGYLRLTRNLRDQKGYIHSSTSFLSHYGLKIDFEYFTYGGAQLFGGSADGITFFLYDAAVKDTDFKIGGFGGSLGYAQYQTVQDPLPIDGVTGGYLGIGLDEYGNFANPTELRSDGPGFKKGSVTIRGRGQGSGATLPNSSVKNYRYITHKQTQDLGFGLTSGSRNPTSENPDYRKAIIHLEPADAPITGYYITVKIVKGGSVPTTYTLIDRHHYPDVAPATLKYGIASSTGFETNYHEIRNLRINAFDPIPPVANNDLTVTTAKNTAVNIPVLHNDTDQNGNIDPATVVIIGQTPGAVITKDAVTGVVTYTPPVGFLGKDTFFYTVKDDESEVSNIARVEVTVVSIKPSGMPDAAETTLNQAVTIDVNSNDPSKIDVIVIGSTLTSRGGSILINPNNTIKYTPPNGFYGSDTFTYKLRNGDGLESDPITVSVLIRRPPIANDDEAITLIDEAVVVDVVANDTDVDGVVNNASIDIKAQPSNGVVTTDVSGNIIYTPKPGFIGVDFVTYTVKDNDGAESLPAQVKITVNSVPKIGLAKALTSVRNSINGSFIVRFMFTLGNYGKEPLEKVSLKDDLAKAFAGAETKIVGINATGTLKANANFNGVGDIELLNESSTLPVAAVEKVELIISLTLVSSEGMYQNSAIAEASSGLNGMKTLDASVAGDIPDPFEPGNVTPSGPTFVELVKGPLYIPEGFSPNGDGINDVFIISNSQGKKINLDVYNRWGNRVYKSTDYQNNWDGRCTEGISLGQDLPVGTYYYIAIIDDKDKYMGYITINR